MWKFFAFLIWFLSNTCFAQEQKGHVVILHIKGVINTGMARFIDRGVKQAESSGAPLLVLILNTPGGLLSSTREIVQRINQSKVPIAVYVSPGGASATSAGTIITMAAHYAAMTPGTNIGAAHPVVGSGEEMKGKMDEKATNDTVAFIKAQATLRNRNVEWAEQAIRKSISATDDEALKLKIIDFIAPDLESLLLKINPKTPVAGVPITELKQTLAEKVLLFLGDPNVSYILMALGGLGLYIELTTPGVILPGVLGAICLLLSFVSLSTLPVNQGAVALLILGLVFLIAELFVTSYGVLTIGGIVSLLLGSLFLIDPSTGDLRLSLALVLPTVFSLSLITFFIAFLLWKSRRKILPKMASFIDYEGIVQSVQETGYNGKCLIRGELWDFDAREPVKQGDSIKVLDQKKFRLVITKK